MGLLLGIMNEVKKDIKGLGEKIDNLTEKMTPTEEGIGTFDNILPMGKIDDEEQRLALELQLEDENTKTKLVSFITLHYYGSSFVTSMEH